MKSHHQLLVTLLDRKSLQYYPMGQLLHSLDQGYQFQYLRGALLAKYKGTQNFDNFPDINKTYHSQQLFPFFQNRIMSKERKDYQSYLNILDLNSSEADEMDILARSAGMRATDSIELFEFPQLISKELGRYEVHFWARYLRALSTEQQEKILHLQPGTQLKFNYPYLQDKEGNRLGELPRYIWDLIQSKQSQTNIREASIGKDVTIQPEVEILVKKVNVPPAPLQYRLLCILRFTWVSPFPPLAGIPLYNPLLQDEHKEKSNFVVGASPLEDSLGRLVLHLYQNNIPSLPFLSQPIGGHINGVSIKQEEKAILKWGTEGEIEFLGENFDTWKNLSQINEPNNPKAELILSDGAKVSAEISYYKGSSSQSLQNQLQFTWSANLLDWSWRRAGTGTVRYWVGITDSRSLPRSYNLVVVTSSSEGWAGLHIPQEPTITLVNLSKQEEKKVAQIYQNPKNKKDTKKTLSLLSSSIRSTIGLETPHLFYGYDDNLNIVEIHCFSMRQKNAQLYIPGRPRDGILVPADYQDWLKYDNKVWLIPFLKCLITSILKKGELNEELLHFNSILDNSYAVHQIIGIGTAIRIFLQKKVGFLSKIHLSEIDLFPEYLRIYCDLNRVHLPSGAFDALKKSYQAALLGEIGLVDSLRKDEAELFLSNNNQRLFCIEMLTTTFASLLASAIGYYGPIYAGLDLTKGKTKEHTPLEKVAEFFDDQAVEAQKCYIAGEPERFPWS